MTRPSVNSKARLMMRSSGAFCAVTVPCSARRSQRPRQASFRFWRTVAASKWGSGRWVRVRYALDASAVVNANVTRLTMTLDLPRKVSYIGSVSADPQREPWHVADVTGFSVWAARPLPARSGKGNASLAGEPAAEVHPVIAVPGKDLSDIEP